MGDGQNLLASHSRIGYDLDEDSEKALAGSTCSAA
jgi:hypothetical protein